MDSKFDACYMMVDNVLGDKIAAEAEVSPRTVYEGQLVKYQWPKDGLVTQLTWGRYD